MLALEKDDLARSTGQDLGLIHSMKRLDSILNNERQPQEIDIDKLTDRKFKIEKTEMETEEMDPDIKEPQIEDQGDGVVEMVQEDEDITDEDDQEVIAVEEVKAEDKKKVVAEIELNESDSEEEETQTLSGTDLQQSSNSEQGRKWYKQNWK